MRRLFGLALALSLVASACGAASAQKLPEMWLVTISRSFGEVDGLSFIDASRIVPAGRYMRAWTRTHYASGRMPFESSMTLDEFDCANRRRRGIQGSLYFSNRNIERAGAGDWSYVTPDTVGEIELDFVCATPEAREEGSAYRLHADESVESITWRLIPPTQ